jgi:hypothetical protein
MWRKVDWFYVCRIIYTLAETQLYFSNLSLIGRNARAIVTFTDMPEYIV